MPKSVEGLKVMILLGFMKEEGFRGCFLRDHSGNLCLLQQFGAVKFCPPLTNTFQPTNFGLPFNLKLETLKYRQG